MKIRYSFDWREYLYGNADAPKYEIEKIRDRFLTFVKKTNTCWNWSGFKDGKGYARFQISKYAERGHRVSYRIHKGEIKKDAVIRHICDNAECVNPKHLKIGTHIDNVKDRNIRNRTAKGFSLPNTKLSNDQIGQIRKLYKDGHKQKEIAKKYNITKGYISAIVTNRRRK